MRKGAIILCGGQSRRMGRDKATLPFGAESLLQRIVRIATEVVAEENIVVVASAQQTLPPLPAWVRVVRDPVPDCGPLAGIAAGLRSLASGTDIDAVFVTSCDAPFIVPAF